MKPSRRNFLKTIALGILGNSFIPSLSLPVFADTEKDNNGIEIEEGFKVFNAETQKSLEALAETLLPGSKELGIKKMFMDYVSKDPGAAGFFDAGFWNLDALSQTKFKKPFYALDKKEDKKEVIEYARVKNVLFFRQFREKVINLYYSNPTVWSRLSYNGPPPAKGFYGLYLSA